MPDTEACAPDTDGENVPLVPDPATEAEELLERAELVAWPVEPVGLLRAEPCALDEACANDWVVAPDIERPVSERAALLFTPDTEARAPDTDGENVPLAPDPATEAEVLLERAEPVAWPVESVGLLRAEPCALDEACANDWVVAPDMA